jgi:hypothetical protein
MHICILSYSCIFFALIAFARQVDHHDIRCIYNDIFAFLFIFLHVRCRQGAYLLHILCIRDIFAYSVRILIAYILHIIVTYLHIRCIQHLLN